MRAATYEGFARPDLDLGRAQLWTVAVALVAGADDFVGVAVAEVFGAAEAGCEGAVAFDANGAVRQVLGLDARVGGTRDE